MGQDPEELRAQIARTREDLGKDLDVLAEKVTPSRVVERKVDATKEKVVGMKDRIMGTASDAAGSVSGTASSAGSSVGSGLGTAGQAVGDTASSAASLVAQAPEQAKARTAGNPFAAGIVAFGVGWLVSGLLPASKAEQRGALKVKEAAQSVAAPVKEGLATAASEVKESLTPAVTDATAAVKDAASSGGSTPARPPAPTPVQPRPRSVPVTDVLGAPAYDDDPRPGSRRDLP